MKILASLLATITGKPRYFPEFEYSKNLWTHNIFRFFGSIFGEVYGIRASVASWRGDDGKDYQYGYTLEAKIAIVESAVRSFFKGFAFKVVILPRLATPMGAPFPNPYLFAIAFDAASGATTGSASLSHTCTGSNLLLYVAIIGDIVTDNLTGVTYNSVAMTVAGKILNPADRWLYNYILVAPSTGANNITESGLVSYMWLSGISYTGCAQSGQPDSHNEAVGQTASTTFTATTTIVASNCWIVGMDYGGGPTGDGTGIRRGTTKDGCQLGDSNGTRGTGSQSFTLAQPSNAYGFVAVSVAPVASATVVKSFLMLLGIG